MRNFKTYENGKEITITKVFEKFLKNQKKLFIRYNTFRDWKDRGLFIKSFEYKNFGKIAKVSYPSKKIEFPKVDINLYFFPHK